jgi:hypothetical protein
MRHKEGDNMHEVLCGDIIQPGDCLRIMVSSKIADVPVTLIAGMEAFKILPYLHAEGGADFMGIWRAGR